LETKELAMKTLLVAHRGALGDFILTFPALMLLRWKYADHRFVGIGRPEYLRLGSEMGLFDAWYDCESAEMLPLFAGESIPKVLGRIDAALFWVAEDPALRKMLTQACQGPVHLHAPFPEKGEHVLDYHLQCLPYFSLPALSGDEPYFPIDSRREAYALIHPGSGSEAKNFDPEFYAFLANELKNRRFKDTRIVLGPLESHLRSQFEGRFSIEQPESVVDLARLLGRAALYVGNDSGVSHLASVLGTKTLALFKNNNHSQWGVRGRDAQNLEASNEAQAMTRIQKALAEI
jgi:heptosyltransferase III